jgi:hypothetical protein
VKREILHQNWTDLRSLRRGLKSAELWHHPFLRLAVRIGVFVVLYVLLEKLLLQVARLPEQSYGEAFILAEMVRRLFEPTPASILTLVGLAAALVVGVRSRSLGPRWASFQAGSALRAVVVLMALVLAWAYGTYDYNLYFDRGHHFDRLLLVAFACLIVWRPVFVLPFLLVLLVILRQFDHPIGGYSSAEQILLVRGLVLFGVFVLVHLLRGGFRSADFVFILCCLVAGHYWVCGYGKLELGWTASDRIHYLLPATYANGWLGFLDPQTIGRLTSMLAFANAPLKFLTLAIECGALVFLWRRNSLRIFLIAWILFHAGTFLLTGICFWKWMILDAGLLMIFFRKSSPTMPIFTPGHFLLSLVLIGGAAFWSGPTKLAWLDARLSYTYRLTATGPNNESYSLPPRFFAPYDYQFTLGNFGYLTKEPHLGVVWGATMDPAVASALEQCVSPEQVWALESARDHRTFHSRRSATFDAFVLRFAGNWNKHGSKPGWWRFFRAPAQLWTSARRPAIKQGQSIKQVVVWQITSLFDGTEYREIRARQVRAIDVNVPSAGGD